MDKETWLSWRRGGIGSSDATILAACAGLVSWPAWLEEGADQALFWDKLGLGKLKAMTDAMRRGVEMEEAVRQMAEQKLGLITPENIESKDVPWIRASLDGLTIEGNEIVEIKVPSRQVVEAAKRGQVIDYYGAQIAHQLMALHGLPPRWTGNEVFHFVVYDDVREDIVIVSGRSRELRRLASKLFALEQRFWAKVQARRPLVGDMQWYETAMKLSAMKTDEAMADAYREQVRAHAEKSGYVPQHFYVRKVAPRATAKVEWQEVFAELGTPQEEIERFRAEPQWVVMGGVRPYETPDLPPQEAEQAVLRLTPSKSDLDDLAKKARSLAMSHGLLVGPFGMRVFKRPGTMQWSKAAQALGVSDAIIQAHTTEQWSPGYTMLVAKGTRKKRTPDEHNAEA